LQEERLFCEFEKSMLHWEYCFCRADRSPLHWEWAVYSNERLLLQFDRPELQLDKSELHCESWPFTLERVPRQSLKLFWATVHSWSQCLM
jgi:hypothetical protein